MTLFRDLLIEKKRRRYYCEVEYLASNGNQYIDTGFVMESGKRMTFNGNMMWTQSQGNANFFYGYRSTSSPEYRGDMRAFFIYGASPEGRLAIRYGVNTDNSTNVAVSLNTKFNMSFDGDNLKVNGTTYATLTQAYTPADYRSMWLFNCNTTGYYSADVNHFIGRIYNWQIWSGGVLVRDLIPVLDWSYVPCMYDRVSGRLFYNQGTGSFTYGREIHYVDYLESTGTQYIDTGITLTNNHSVEVDYQLTSASQNRKGIFGGLVTSGPRFGALLSPSNNYLEFGYGSTNVWYQPGLPDTQRHVMKQQKNLLYFDGVLTYTFNTATFTQDFTAPLGNFTYTNYNPASAKYYSSKWWDNDTLVRDYAPAIDENGVCFWFDKVTHSCFLNAGTGVFKYPAREVEYLQSNRKQYIDTGISFPNGFRVKGEAAFTEVSPSCGLFGAWGTSNPYYRNFLGISQLGFYTGFGGSSYQYFGTATANHKYSFNVCNVQGKEYIELDGTVYPFEPEGSVGTYTSTTAYIFGFHKGTGVGEQGAEKLYWLKAYDKDDNLVGDYIPAFKDGSVGLYNKKIDTLHTNLGTVEFSFGKIVESRYE